MTPQEIISDDEITRVHGYANFGSMTPRQVVNDGVHKYAIGYTGGSTQVAILREHGLITATKNARYRADLTQKGKRYARSINLYDLQQDRSAQLSTALQVPEVAALVEAALEKASTLKRYLSGGMNPSTDAQHMVDDLIAALAAMKGPQT